MLAIHPSCADGRCGEQPLASSASASRPSASFSLLESPRSAAAEERYRRLRHQRPRLELAASSAQFLPSSARQNPYASSSLILPRRSKFEVEFRTVPRQFEANFLAFQQLLQKLFPCSLCGGHFSPAQSGTLLCSYHPFAHYGTGARATPYHGPLLPSPCPVCNEQHLSCPIRKRPLHERYTGDDGITTNTFSQVERHQQTDEIPLMVESFTSSLGCVAVDHCTSIVELFQQPYVALPLVYFGHLTLSKSVSLDRLPREGELRNWLVVDQAEQLVKTLVISVPYSQTPFFIPIQVLYEAMALKFGIESLADGAREARVWNNKSSLSQLAHLNHPDAERKDLLHKLDSKRVKFAPFIIIARVAQNAFRSEGMKLI